MLYVPSKYSPSHSSPLNIWLRRRAMSIWNAVPSMFARPCSSDRQFAFVCGCGHSGTTLTAAKLGSHSSVLLLGRETNAFGPECGAHCSRRIADQWDYFAQIEGKSLVLEKTPKHVHSISKIRKVIPHAKIIITARNPLDNIASLYARFGDIDGAIARWLADHRKVLRAQEEKFVRVVKYEELTANPHKSFRSLCDFLGITWEPSLPEQRDTKYGAVKQNCNMAMRATQVSQPVSANLNNWSRTLTESQAKSVLVRTREVAARLGYVYSPDMVLTETFNGSGYDEKDF